MPPFSYTSGDPDNLVAGQNASMADIQGPLVDLETFLNGGIGTSNLASNAGVLETQIATGSSGLAKGVFAAYRNAALSNASGADVVYDSEEYDVSGWFNTTNGRFTPQVAGFYRLSWQVQASGALTLNNWWKASLHKNSVLHRGGNVSWQVTTAALVVSNGSANVTANGSSDFFSVNLTHNNGAGGGVATGVSATFFHGELIGRA